MNSPFSGASLGAFLLGALGVALIALIVWDAFETILVPRRIGRRFRPTAWFYRIAWRVCRAIARVIRKPSRREALLGFFAPLSQILLLVCWAMGLVFAFALLTLAIERGQGMSARFATILYMSGETFFTLGFGDVTPQTAFGRMISVCESGLGFGFLGAVIGYLPTMYAAFSQRETEIALMDARAGSPPTAAEFLRRSLAEEDQTLCEEHLNAWERWSAQLLETHISYPQLAYYRSQHGNQSWLATLTVILDSTAVILAGAKDGEARRARLTFAMARHAVVDITQVFLRRFPEPSAPRLTPEGLDAIRMTLDQAEARPANAEEFETRLSELRLLYEPYAQALAAFLMFELPPWAHTTTRRDRWELGPWDRLLPGTEEALGEEHF